MTTMQLPPPPKTCPKCGREVKVTLAGTYARCSSLHLLTLNRLTGRWEVSA